MSMRTPGTRRDSQYWVLMRSSIFLLGTRRPTCNTAGRPSSKRWATKGSEGVASTEVSMTMGTVAVAGQPASLSSAQL